ncbi:hypothetical protein IWX49DRAFT_627155 [Phyllosticta citricarpa]|uniref:Survival motor neuron Tudor domain-containing protein n=2 Tax=Phyllosticta TaxID=121621 RepID=A0ABR1MS27_9PEZI
MAANIDLNDRRAWDDRALIDGWDAAQEEYNLYHSVQLHGENILHYLDREQLESLKDAFQDSGEDDYIQAIDAELEARPAEPAKEEEANVPGDAQAGDEEMKEANEIDKDDTAAQDQLLQETAASIHHVPNPTAPGPIMKMEDELLRNLMLSWYYAGYYQGKYEERSSSSASQAPGSGGPSSK